MKNARAKRANHCLSLLNMQICGVLVVVVVVKARYFRLKVRKTDKAFRHCCQLTFILSYQLRVSSKPDSNKTKQNQRRNQKLKTEI